MNFKNKENTQHYIIGTFSGVTITLLLFSEMQNTLIFLIITLMLAGLTKLNHPQGEN
jgi:hypothetical protein